MDYDAEGGGKVLLNENDVETVMLLGKITDGPKDYVKIGLDVEDYSYVEQDHTDET